MKDYIFKNCFKIDLSAVIKLLIKGILFTKYFFCMINIFLEVTGDVCTCHTSFGSVGQIALRLTQLGFPPPAAVFKKWKKSVHSQQGRIRLMCNTTKNSTLRLLTM